MATRHRRTSGSVRQRESGRWQARVRDPVTNRMVSLGMFPTKADADKALALTAADQTRGAWIDPGRGKTTLAEYAGAWLTNNPTLRPRTRRLYSDLLRLHIVPTLGDGTRAPHAGRGPRLALGLAGRRATGCQHGGQGLSAPPHRPGRRRGRGTDRP
jgi:hypothetical protein